ncbi:restriction endonuclease subunit S [Dolichospermum circinale CS-537/01]|uniref:Restriction endonuclease subunit S n=1 Tax=Dolichospermum circinale CS-537/01 TaxID=3021739 RepID=A0ABT5A9Q6_9CYAN|nr:restriction endonuclease subunit S [Dolichospermum circinale]MDB9488695.1 restriction endonuclease subunit S [Dolichospermum circinale CS-537/01]
MSKWKTKRLGDFILFPRGFDLLAKDRTEGNIPVISSSGITGFHNQYKAKGPGVIIGRKGTLGTVHYSEQDYWPHDTTLWVTDFKGNLPRFIYYLLPLLQLEKYDVGSSNPTLNRNYIHEIITTLPPLEEQRKIASVLSSLDDKIELNNRINSELENLAKTIYDYWFVQFDFPDENGKPYKSSGGKMVYNQELKREIPAGWEVGTLQDWIDFKRGISYKSTEIQDTGIPLLNLNSFTLSGKFKPDGTKYFNGSFKEDSRLNYGDLVIAITDVTRNAIIIGKSFIVPDLFD